MSVNKFIIKIDPINLVPKSTARLYYYAAIWITIAEGVVLGLLWNRLPSVVPLFFTEPWGTARLAPKLFLVLLPMLSLGSIVLNLIIGRATKGVSVLLSYTLAVASVLVAVMCSIAIWGILQSLL